MIKKICHRVLRCRTFKARIKVTRNKGLALRRCTDNEKLVVNLELKEVFGIGCVLHSEVL